MRRAFSRRTVLRGAGVALALPWLESLAPRPARGQALEPRRTFVAFSFPCGVAKFWTPTAAGAGDAWALSPLLAPLAPVKSHVTVLGNVGNRGPFGVNLNPSHSNLNAAFLTCTKPTGPTPGGTPSMLGPSVDQVVAKALGGRTRLSSLQVGLSTTLSYPDGLAPEFSRSISWASATEPLGKLVDPQVVFDKIVGAGAFPTAQATSAGAFARARREANKSVLDYVLGHASSVRGKLGRSDLSRMDAFVDSVRQLEKRVDTVAPGNACTVPPRPPASWDVTPTQTPVPGYDRNAHADLMIDLVLMALRCDVTRVVSFMFDDSRSDFGYSFLEGRTFDAPGVTPAAPVNGWWLHALASSTDTNANWAIINRWFVEKLARFCVGLQAVDEGAGTMLDAATVWFGSEMHGSDHDALDLPVLYVGGAGGRLKTNRFIDFAATPRQTERLANVYLTFLRNVFDLPVASFGTGAAIPMNAMPLNAYGGGTEIVPEIVV